MVKLLHFNRFKCVREYGSSMCNKCLESCPTQAIYLLNDRIQINASYCTYCGKCQTVCPNEAIVIKDLSSVSSNSCEGLGGDIPCIAFISPEFLLSNNIKEIYVCKDCSKGVDVKAEIERIKTHIKNFNIYIDIKLKETNINLKRRYYLFKEVRVIDFYKIDKSSPKKRKILGSRVSYYKKIDAMKCTFCEICVNICPNGALRSDGNGKIYFEPLNCTGCELCIHSCPTKAIQKSDSFQGNPLVSLSVKRCSVCGAKFHGDRDKCPKCSREEEELKGIFQNFL